MKSNKRKIFSYKQKRCFLLIEILIALSIIALLIVPLTRNPIYFFKSQIKSLERLECERLADLTFLDIKTALYKEEIDTNSLAKNKKDASFVSLDEKTLAAFNDKKINRSYKIYSTRKEKKSTDNTLYKFLTIKVYLQPIDQKEKYEYDYKMVY